MNDRTERIFDAMRLAVMEIRAGSGGLVPKHADLLVIMVRDAVPDATETEIADALESWQSQMEAWTDLINRTTERHQAMMEKRGACRESRPVH